VAAPFNTTSDGKEKDCAVTAYKLQEKCLPDDSDLT